MTQEQKDQIEGRANRIKELKATKADLQDSIQNLRSQLEQTSSQLIGIAHRIDEEQMILKDLKPATEKKD